LPCWTWTELRGDLSAYVPVAGPVKSGQTSRVGSICRRVGGVSTICGRSGRANCTVLRPAPCLGQPPRHPDRLQERPARPGPLLIFFVFFGAAGCRRIRGNRYERSFDRAKARAGRPPALGVHPVTGRPQGRRPRNRGPGAPRRVLEVFFLRCRKKFRAAQALRGLTATLGRAPDSGGRISIRARLPASVASC